jgi:hypothetical protein
MIRHAGRGVPWVLVAIGTALIAALLRLVEEWPYYVWPLQGIAVGLLAGLAVWCFDEPAAAIVDTLPRSLAWRTAARGLGVNLLLVGWLLAVSWTAAAYYGKPGHVAWQGLAAVLAGTAWATWRRSRGTAMPARPTSTALVCGAAYLALVRPVDDLLPLFPYTAAGPWASSVVVWTGIAAASTTVLGVVLLEFPGKLLGRAGRKLL